LHAPITTISTIISIIIITNIIKKANRGESGLERGGAKGEGRVGRIGVVSPGSEGVSPYGRWA
jgi:hypothetical protein